jgi:preprotein translocase subunit SecF
MPGAISRLHMTPVLYLALLAAVMAVAVVVAMRYGGTVHSGALVSHAHPDWVYNG